MSAGRWTIHACGVVALAAAAIAWHGLAVHPLLTASKRAAEASKEAEAARGAVLDLLARRDRCADEWTKIEAELARTAVRLQPATAVNARLAELTHLAESEGLVVERVEPGPPVETPLAVRVPLRLGARGSSPAAIRFLARLKASFPDVAVEGFEVAGRDGQADAALQFDCVWYADRASPLPATAAAEP